MVHSSATTSSRKQAIEAIHGQRSQPSSSSLPSNLQLSSSKLFKSVPPHLLCIFRTTTGLLSLIHVKNIILDTLLIHTNFAPTHGSSNVFVPHFYYTNILSALVLPTRYADSFATAAASPTTLLILTHIRLINLSCFTLGSILPPVLSSIINLLVFGYLNIHERSLYDETDYVLTLTVLLLGLSSSQTLKSTLSLFSDILTPMLPGSEWMKVDISIDDNGKEIKCRVWQYKVIQTHVVFFTVLQMLWLVQESNADVMMMTVLGVLGFMPVFNSVVGSEVFEYAYCLFRTIVYSYQLYSLSITPTGLVFTITPNAMYFLLQLTATICFIPTSAMIDMESGFNDLIEDCNGWLPEFDLMKAFTARSSTSSSVIRQTNSRNRRNKNDTTSSEKDQPLLLKFFLKNLPLFFTASFLLTIAMHTIIIQTSSLFHYRHSLFDGDYRKCLNVQSNFGGFRYLPLLNLKLSSVSASKSENLTFCNGDSLIKIAQSMTESSSSKNQAAVDIMQPLNLYSTPFTSRQVLRISTDPSFVLQIGMLSAKSTNALSGADKKGVEGMVVKADYYRSFYPSSSSSSSSSSVDAGARLFYKVTGIEKYEKNMLDVNPFAHDYFGDEGFLTLPPFTSEWDDMVRKSNEFTEINSSRGSSRSGGRTTCFSVSDYDSVDNMVLQSHASDNEEEDEKAVSACDNNRTPVDIVAVTGNFVVKSNGGTEELKEGGGSVKFERGARYSISHVSYPSLSSSLSSAAANKKRRNLMCMRHPGCSYGAFDVENGFLSRAGWESIYNEADEEDKDRKMGKGRDFRRLWTGSGAI